MLEIFMAYFGAEIDISKCKIYIRHTFFTTFSEITEEVGPDCNVYVHMTRSQLELNRARCKISNKGYLSLNVFVILCHNMVIRSWDITTIPKGLSETLFGRF